MTGRGVSGRKPFLCFISKWLASLSVRYRLLPLLLDRLLPYLYLRYYTDSKSEMNQIKIQIEV